MGHHQEASATAVELIVTAERLDSTACTVARYDAGLVALAAAAACDAVDLIGRALADGAVVSRPAARLAPAEAPAAAGDLTEATAELRRAALEPVSQADQPCTLVPQMTRVQALIARAQGDHATARRRFDEAADGWRWRADHNRAAGEEYMAALVDLGRPPVVGLVDPAWELRRVLAESTGPARMPDGDMPGFTLTTRTRAPSRRCGSCCSTPCASPNGGRAWRPCASTTPTPTPFGPTATRLPDAPAAAHRRGGRSGHHLLPGVRHRRHLAARRKDGRHGGRRPRRAAGSRGELWPTWPRRGSATRPDVTDRDGVGGAAQRRQPAHRLDRAHQPIAVDGLIEPGVPPEAARRRARRTRGRPSSPRAQKTVVAAIHVALPQSTIVSLPGQAHAVHITAPHLIADALLGAIPASARQRHQVPAQQKILRGRYAFPTPAQEVVMPYGRCVTYFYCGDRRQLIERAPPRPRRASR